MCDGLGAKGEKMAKKRCEFVLAGPYELSEDTFARLKKKLAKYGINLHSVHEEAAGFWRIAICPKDVSKEEATEIYDQMTTKELEGL